MKDYVVGRLGEHVKVGASVPVGLDGCRLLTELKLGNTLLTLLPRDKAEALAVSEYCKQNHIYFFLSELLYRGTKDLCFAFRSKVSRDEFYTKEEFEQICEAGGKYYMGRVVIGEAGGMLYWPREYTINRGAGDWDQLPPVDTVDKAKDAYVNKMQEVIEYEREEFGCAPFWNGDAGCTVKYQIQAGIDMPLFEEMPGDCTFIMANVRGAATAYGKPYSAHIAMACYGGVNLDTLWLKRFRIAQYFSYLSGCSTIYPESGHFTYSQKGEGYGFSNPLTTEIRSILREFNQFSQIHSRPADGPKVTLGIVYGNLDGFPGLWNKYVWGQYADEKWLWGAAEYGWELVDDLHRKARWDDENVQGETDFYGNPPYGMYDSVPIEAPIEVLNKYSCLVFLGWNTMTEEIYEKLKVYVESGGHLIMSVPHLSTEVDRAKDPKHFRDGDWRDLFGVVAGGKGKTGVAGLKTFNESTIPSYKMPVWRVRTDPRFMGDRELTEVEIHGARIISGWSNTYVEPVEDVMKNPVLTEFTLGKGKAFLLCSWTYPGDKGWSPYMKDLLRIISCGEQGDIRVIASDKIRYAVYDGKLADSEDKITVVYLLNTEYDTPHLVDLWIDGKVCRRILVEPTELNVIYMRGDIVLSSSDRGIDLEAWETVDADHHVGLFCRKDIEMRVFNLSANRATIDINGVCAEIQPGSETTVNVGLRIDPERPEFYAADFLEEPNVDHLKRPDSGPDGMDWTGFTPY